MLRLFSALDLPKRFNKNIAVSWIVGRRYIFRRLAAKLKEKVVIIRTWIRDKQQQQRHVKSSASVKQILVRFILV
jgi:hypothetical protein